MQSYQVNPWYKDLPYAERLSVLKLPSLKYRRLRNDMIQVCKYLHTEYNVVNDILVRDTSERKEEIV